MREITRIGSASIATDGGGNVIANSELAYKPFGGVLGGGTGLDTPYRFTNQRITVVYWPNAQPTRQSSSP